MNNREMLRFRESFRGYNRDDVNSYIEQISFMFSRKEAELRAHISELEAKLSSVRTGCTHTDDEWNGLKDELEAAKSEIEELKGKIEAENSVDHGSDDEKSKLYDSMSAQVGNIIILANNNAEKIVNDANTEASSIKENARREADKVISEAIFKKEELEKQLDEQLKSISANCFNDYNALIDDVNVRLCELTDSIKTRSSSLVAKLNESNKELEKKFSSFCANSESNEG